MKNKLKQLQELVLENKKTKGFNTTNIEQEFCYLYGEVGEAYTAYCRELSSLPEELADVAIYLLGISEILGIDLYEEILKKMEINRNREYRTNDHGIPVKN